MNKFQPLNGYALVKLDQQKERVVEGIYLGEGNNEEFLKGSVVSLGSGRRAPDGYLIPFDIKIGDKLLIMKYGPISIKLDDNKYVLIGEEHVLGILEESVD